MIATSASLSAPALPEQRQHREDLFCDCLLRRGGREFRTACGHTGNCG